MANFIDRRLWLKQSTLALAGLGLPKAKAKEPNFPTLYQNTEDRILSLTTFNNYKMYD